MLSVEPSPYKQLPELFWMQRRDMGTIDDGISPLNLPDTLGALIIVITYDVLCRCFKLQPVDIALCNACSSIHCHMAISMDGDWRISSDCPAVDLSLMSETDESQIQCFHRCVRLASPL